MLKPKLQNPRIEEAYSGFLKLKKALFTALDLQSSTPPPCTTMEYMERGDAVSALVRIDKKFIILKQFRIGSFVRTEEASSYSNVAGMIDEGETPRQAILRELKEEIGLPQHKIQEIVELGTFYTSPGGTTERMTFFFVQTGKSFCPKIVDFKEIHEVLFVTEKEYRDLIKNNSLSSMQTATCFMLAEEKYCF